MAQDSPENTQRVETYYTFQMARARAVETVQGSPLHVLMHIHVHATLPKDFCAWKWRGCLITVCNSTVARVWLKMFSAYLQIKWELCYPPCAVFTQWRKLRSASRLQGRPRHYSWDNRLSGNSDLWIQTQKNFIIHNKWIKWKFALWVTRIPPRQKGSLTIQHHKGKSNIIK